MGRPRNTVPTYRRHKASNKAFIIPPGTNKPIYLGAWNSAESRKEYNRIRAEIEARDNATASTTTPGTALTVNEVVQAFWKHAKQHYRHADGTQTSEIKCLASAVELLVELYGHTSACDFGPLALKALQQQWVKRKICRNSVNARTNRVRRVFKWAASEELVPFTAYQALTTVAGLKAGRTTAKESPPVEVVRNLDVVAVTSVAQPTIRVMVLVQRLTGMRPGELCSMRAGEVDRTTLPWVYTPASHKTTYRGGVRRILIGPVAAELLGPLLDGRQPGDYVFSPKRARAERFATMRAARKSKVQPSQVSRAKPRSEIIRQPTDRYSTAAYAAAVRRTCRYAGVPTWSPNRLRHSFATEARATFGLEAAQVLLGHTRADVTQVYAERNTALGVKVAQQMG